jgi:hypothetical protein
MANVGSLFVVLGLQASDYQNGLRKATKEANTAMNQIKREFAGLNMKAAIVGVTALTTAFVYAGKKFADAANEADKNKRRFDMAFGDMAAANEVWVDSYSKGVGRSKDDLQSFMASYDMMLKNMGVGAERASEMSRELVQRGVDIASAFNIPESEVMPKLLKGLTGMGRGLMDYGIVLKGVTQTDEEGNEVLTEKGKKMGNLEKVTTSYNAMLQQSVKFQNDATRNAGDYGNQMKRLEANIKDVKENNLKLKDSYTAVYKEMNRWLEDPKNIETMKKMGDEAANLTMKITRVAEGIADNREIVVTAIEIMFGAWAVNKLVKFGSSLGAIYTALGKLIKLSGAGMAGISAIGASAAATAYGGYKMGTNMAEGKQSGYGPMGITPGFNYYNDKRARDAAEAKQINYQNPLSKAGNGFMSNIIPFKPESFDFQKTIKAVEDTAEKITTISKEQQSEVLSAQREYEKTKLDLIKNEGQKRLAEIGLWYKEEQDKAKDNAAALAIIDKTRGVKLDLYDEWWKDQLNKAAEDRKKRFNEIIATQMEQSRELEAATKTKVIEFARGNRDLSLQNSLNPNKSLDSYRIERGAEVNRFADQQADLKKQYGKSPEYMKLMEGAAEEHKQRMIAIDRDQYEKMKDNSLKFAEYWADNLVSVVEQSGNSFNNIAQMFEQMIKKMAIKAAAMGLINFVTGGAGGFAAGFMGALKMPGFAAGGYTGSGNSNEIAGYVHKNEYVIPASKMSSYTTTDNSKWELHFHDSEGVKKMTGMPDEQFAEQFKRAVRDKKIDIRKIA